MATTTHAWQVSGMHCSSCSILIDEAIEDLDGVTSATTSLKKKLTTVTLDSTRCDPDQVVEAIRAAGYQANQTTNQATNQSTNQSTAPARRSWFRPRR